MTPDLMAALEASLNAAKRARGKEWYCAAGVVGYPDWQCTPEDPAHGAPCGWVKEAQR